LDDVKYATLEWVDWFNNRRPLEPIGNVPPAESKLRIIVPRVSCRWQPDSNPGASWKIGAVQRE
jgi:hypothetical protein